MKSKQSAPDRDQRHDVDPGINTFERLRYERGLTQQQVADGAGISRGTVVGLERARRPRPTARIALALADFYGIEVADLLSVTESRRAA